MKYKTENEKIKCKNCKGTGKVKRKGWNPEKSIFNSEDWGLWNFPCTECNGFGYNIKDSLEYLKIEIKQLKMELNDSRNTTSKIIGNLSPAIDYLQKHSMEIGLQWGDYCSKWIGDNLPKIMEDSKKWKKIAKSLANIDKVIACKDCSAYLKCTMNDNIINEVEFKRMIELCKESRIDSAKREVERNS